MRFELKTSRLSAGRSNQAKLGDRANLSIINSNINISICVLNCMLNIQFMKNPGYHSGTAESLEYVTLLHPIDNWQ